MMYFVKEQSEVKPTQARSITWKTLMLEVELIWNQLEVKND